MAKKRTLLPAKEGVSVIVNGLGTWRVERERERRRAKRSCVLAS
jgi:hypothetical protein